jgi:serine/threonine-protein kinase
MPLLLVAAVAFGFFVVRGDIFGPARDIGVPDLSGMSSTIAQQQLLGLGLHANVTEEASESVGQDHVIRQDPAAGVKVARAATIALVVSSGLPQVTIPDVTGFTVADAQRTLTTAKLRSKITQTYNATVPAGAVISLNPPGGGALREGDVVTLEVSKGIAPVVVPSVVNLQIDDARRRLAALGLRVSVTQTSNDAIPVNAVAAQAPDPGSTLAPQGEVALVVSTGPVDVVVPSVVGNDPPTAQATLAQAGFTPVLNYNVDATDASGKIAFQSPDAGANAKKGSTVTIFVSVTGTVPDVTGMPLDAAKGALLAAGYKVGNVPYGDGPVAEGSVISTEPVAGTQLKPGESVNIMVKHTTP